MKLLVTYPVGAERDTFIPSEVVRKLDSMYEVVWNYSSEQFSEDELKEKIRDVDVCIVGWRCRRLDKNILECAEKLKLVAHLGGSVAPVVSDYLYEKGIRVISGNNVFAESVAEGTLAYMLCSLRDIVSYSNGLQKGQWKSEDFFNESLLDQSVGLVGFGTVARYLTKMLAPFRARVKIYDPFVKDNLCEEYNVIKTSLEDLFKTCKIISIHAPETDGTYHMIGRELLGMVQDGALLINTSRGSVIDEEILADELQKKRFKAVLDVYEFEPLPADSRLIGLSNAILIPHMGGPTMDRRKHVILTLLEDINRFFNGEKLKNEIIKEHAERMSR